MTSGHTYKIIKSICKSSPYLRVTGHVESNGVQSKTAEERRLDEATGHQKKRLSYVTCTPHPQRLSQINKESRGGGVKEAKGQGSWGQGSVLHPAVCWHLAVIRQERHSAVLPPSPYL